MGVKNLTNIFTVEKLLEKHEKAYHEKASSKYTTENSTFIDKTSKISIMCTIHTGKRFDYSRYVIKSSTHSQTGH